MRTSALWPLLVVVAACVHGGGDAALAPPLGAPPDVQAACALATHRCAQCHPLARVTLAQIDSAQHWEWYVARMRRQPRSGITDEEQPRIVRCLVARSFGLAASRPLPEVGP